MLTFLYVGAVVLAYQTLSWPGAAVNIQTPAMGSIEKRYSSGGAAPSHTPGAATERGNHTNVQPRSEGASGYGDPAFAAQAADMKGT